MKCIQCNGELNTGFRCIDCGWSPNDDAAGINALEMESPCPCCGRTDSEKVDRLKDLLNRIRPNCEVPTWVYLEIEKIVSGSW